MAGPADAPRRRRRTVGLLVNPVAGMGGPVGLKGSDDRAALEAAGADPVAPGRAARFLERVEELGLGAEVAWVACPGPMGADALAEAGLDDGGDAAEGSVEVLEADPPLADPTTADDTRRLAPRLAGASDLLVIVGGDGTAADVADALGAAGPDVADVPVLGVPAGVKMHSGVFAQDPAAAADVLAAWLAGGAAVETVEVRDVDEAAFRDGRLELVRKGRLRAPAHPLRVPGKVDRRPDAEAARALAGALVDRVREGRWVLGPGSTLLAVKEALGLSRSEGTATPLGVDVVEDGEPLAADADEATLLDLCDAGTRVLVAPIGGQGVVLGRGNQPVSAAVLRVCGGAEALVVCATPGKLRGLDALRFDTGDADLDAAFGDHLRVVTGPQRSAVMRVRAGGRG